MQVVKETRVGLYKELLTQLEELVKEGFFIQAYLRHKYVAIGPIMTDGHVRTSGDGFRVVTVVDYDDMELTLFTVFLGRGPSVDQSSRELTEAVLLLIRAFILDMSGTVSYGGQS